MSIASIFAITAMLLILSIFFILVININTAAETIQQDYDSIEIYLQDETTREQADEIINDLDGREGVDDVYYKTKDEAMNEFRQRWGENAYLLDSLEEKSSSQFHSHNDLGSGIGGSDSSAGRHL